MAVRHRIVHAYFDLDWQILWDAATDDIPALRREILHILATEYPESESAWTVAPGQLRIRPQNAIHYRPKTAFTPAGPANTHTAECPHAGAMANVCCAPNWAFM